MLRSGRSGSAIAWISAANPAFGDSEAATEARPQRSSGRRLPSASAACADSQVILPRPVLTGTSGIVASQPPSISIVHSSA